MSRWVELLSIVPLCNISTIILQTHNFVLSVLSKVRKWDFQFKEINTHTHIDAHTNLCCKNTYLKDLRNSILQAGV